MCYVLFSWQADSNDNKRKNEMEEKERIELIKSMIRTYYLAEKNAEFVSHEITIQLDKDFEKLMTKEERGLFYDSNTFYGEHWDTVGI